MPSSFVTPKLINKHANYHILLSHKIKADFILTQKKRPDDSGRFSNWCA